MRTADNSPKCTKCSTWSARVQATCPWGPTLRGQVCAHEKLPPFASSTVSGCRAQLNFSQCQTQHRSVCPSQKSGGDHMPLCGTWSSGQVSSRVCVRSKGRVLVSVHFPFVKTARLPRGSRPQVQSLREKGWRPPPPFSRSPFPVQRRNARATEQRLSGSAPCLRAEAAMRTPSL